MKKKLTSSELNSRYKQAKDADQDVFAEQRSNLLLTAGEHFSKKNSAFWNRVREARDLSNEQKLRLTKNHIYRISKLRTGILLSHAPGVRIVPNNESELQDQKAAELNQAVWNYAKTQQKLKEKTGQFAFDFFNCGEVCAKVYWNPGAGKVVGYEQAVDEETGENLVDENGAPVSSGKAIFNGELLIERLHSFNLLRAPQAKTMDDSPYLIYEKVVSYSDLMEMVKGDEEKEKIVAEGKDSTFVIFDSNKQGYAREKNVLTVVEHYYRPCREYPEGYFFICTDTGILWEGPLPFGIMPIVYKGHDEIPSTPRHRSPIKQLRPYQIEINRAASKVAEHQVSLSDDKVLVQMGTKIQAGSMLPGVRTLQYSGMAPTILPGRSGDQYFEYIDSQIQEMYQVAMLDAEVEEKQGGNDSWGQLYKSIRHKKKFAQDGEKFEQFLMEVCELYLTLAKHYLDESFLIPAIGRSEMINISEFKNTEKLCYQIKVEPASDDIETMYGKQLMLNHILQYSSAQLAKEDIGKIIRLMPFANNEKMFDDFTVSYDRGTNILLQLERGQQPTPSKYDDAPYLIKRLTNRQVQSDYEFLPDNIKQNYEMLIDAYETMEAEKQAQLQAAASGFIPSGGASIKVAWYVPDPNNSSRSIQAVLPAESISWLVDRLNAQGSSQEALQGLGTGAQAGIAEQYLKFGETNQGWGESPQMMSGTGIGGNL